MSCIVQTVRAKFRHVTAGHEQLIEIGGLWGAVAIGAASDLDRCWLFPKSQIDSIAAGTNGASKRQEAFRNGRLVSVERPFIGQLEGPFYALSAYALDVLQSGGVAERGGIHEVALGGNSLILPQLELDFYKMVPPWLPTKRAPYEQAIYRESASLGTFRFPGWGRRAQSLSLSLGGRTTGTLTWRLQGINAASWPVVSGVADEHPHDLQGSTVESADFDRTYFFDGEFDYYVLTLTNGALDAGAVTGAIWKAWD
jgi:hypothetical protein